MNGGPIDEKIERVHRYIEYCIMYHITKRQTIDCLASEANIEPFFTETIWEQLEAENEEFFRAYYVRLAVRDQTVRFNRALSMQAQLMVHHHHQPPPLNIHQHHINANYNGLQRGSNGSQQQQQQQGLNGHQQHNGNYNGLQQPRPNGSQQHNGNHNGLLQPRPNGSQQQQAMMHQQHNGNYNGLQQPRPNGSQQQQQHNGNHNRLLQPRPNGSQQQQAMMHQQRNGNYSGLQLQPRPNGSQQHIINGINGFQHRSNGSQQQPQQQLHQHNIANNASHVVSTMNAAQLGREAMQQQQQQLNSGTSSTRSNLQSYAGTPTSHFTSSSNFPESTSPVGDQAESSSAQNPVDPEEVESGDGSTNVSS